MNPETTSAALIVRLKNELSAPDREELVLDMADPQGRAGRERRDEPIRKGFLFRPYQVAALEAAALALRPANGGKKVTEVEAISVIFSAGLRALLNGKKMLAAGQAPALRKLLDLLEPGE